MKAIFKKTTCFYPFHSFISFGILICFSNLCYALTDLKCYLSDRECQSARRGSSSSADPSTSNRVRINPSAVPTAKGFGLDIISFKGDSDFGIVQGTGRIGAAISPSNSEETFFGPPGFELSESLLYRKQNSEKYQSQKTTFATAANVSEKNGSGLRRFSLNIGLMAKYNKLTYNTKPGVGFSGILGPFTFGYSLYSDETQFDLNFYGSDYKTTIQYMVDTYNIGIYLNSLIIDYSVLHVQTMDISIVKLLTASLMAGPFVFTASKRSENTIRPAYNFETRQLETQQIKDEVFGGLQYRISSNFMIGFLHNYYLLHEYSFIGVLFF